VRLVVKEFPGGVHYPILLSKDADTGAFYCGAMLGFDAGENLFLDDKGHDAYSPLICSAGLFIRRGPTCIDLEIRASTRPADNCC